MCPVNVFSLLFGSLSISLPDCLPVSLSELFLMQMRSYLPKETFRLFLILFLVSTWVHAPTP